MKKLYPLLILLAYLTVFVGCQVPTESKLPNSVNSEIILPQATGPEKGKNYVVPKSGPEMVWLEPGRFNMGSPVDEQGRDPDENPRHEVTLSNGFWIGKFEITQNQYRAIKRRNPSHFQGGDNPVEKVSWNDAIAYCERLTKRHQMEIPAGYTFRLPTEAEWEYACRAGTTSKFSFGNNDSELGDYGWFLDTSNFETHPGGRKNPNPWGLYDMHGNVWEWCMDPYLDSYVDRNPSGRSAEDAFSERVFRGGGWSYLSEDCRSANRDWGKPSLKNSDLGFRIVLGPSS